MVELIKSWKCFDGMQNVYRHSSISTSTDMEFSVFIPAHKKEETLPVLTFLSGLTCTWENFTTKAGAQRYAAEHKIILVMPDTSPRGDNVPNDPSYDLGQGAGFYVDATEEPWSTNFRMWSYIHRDLPEAVKQVAPVDTRRWGISGHSMGGHGALVSALRLPEQYKSVSAIAPIVAPSQVPWGQKALKAYLGSNQAEWAEYDATELVKTGSWKKPILIDQGDNDEFLDQQLRPDLFTFECQKCSIPLEINMHKGYDHSYYFISSIIGRHIEHHAKELNRSL